MRARAEGEARIQPHHRRIGRGGPGRQRLVPGHDPGARAEPQRRPDKPVFLSIKSDRSLAVGEETIARESLAVALDTATKGNREERIFVRADRAVSYGDVMEVMNALRSTGYLKIGLVGLEVREVKK